MILYLFQEMPPSSLNYYSLNNIYLLYDSTVHNETNLLNNAKILQEAPMSNNFNNINGNNDVLPQHFVNYINYELRLFEEITDKKFFFDTFRNDGFELNVCEPNENDKRIIYRASNLYQFIERLFMIREYLIKNFDNKITTSATFHD